jgi:four helix bundle protein
MGTDSPTPHDGHAFDLEERTAQLGEAVVRFARTIAKNPFTTPPISRLIRAGTSVGANYCEADDAVSRTDFKNKIGTCRQEARETKLWLRLMAAAEPDLKTEARKPWQEAEELHLVFAAIWRKS